jgi:hypothetical protein
MIQFVLVKEKVLFYQQTLYYVGLYRKNVFDLVVDAGLQG